MKHSITRRRLASAAAAAHAGRAPSPTGAGELPKVWGEDFLTPWSPPDNVKRDLTPGPSHIRLSCQAYRMRKAPNGSYGDWVKTIREAGYTACEAGAAQWDYKITDSEIREMQAALKQHDVEFYTLHVWINIIDPDLQKREAAHALNCRAIEMADRLGMKSHPHPYWRAESRVKTFPSAELTRETWEMSVAAVKI